MKPTAEDFQRTKPEDVLKELSVDPARGLTEEEAKHRLEIYGFNEVPERKASPWLLFLRKFWGLTAWMLEAVIVLSLVLQKYLDAIIVGGLLLFNALMSFWQEHRASQAVDALKEKLRVNARVLRDGQWKLVPARALVPGDIVRLRAGDFVPADVKLFMGEVEVDQSALTGESLTVHRASADMVFCGAIIKRGEADGVVVLTGPRTYFGRTVELVQIARPKFHAEEVTGQVVRWLLILVGVALAAALIAAWTLNFSLWEVLPLGLVLLASSIPVALPAMFTITMSLGALELAHKGVLVTRLSAAEDAATMDTLCVDKTGTITQNKLALAEVYPVGEHTAEEVLRWAALASEEANQDPIDLAILHGVNAQNLDLRAFQRVSFTPFDPQRRRTEAVVEGDGRRFLVMKGAVDTIASLTHTDPSLWEELRQAEVGIAVSNATDVAKAAASVVLTEPGLINIVDLVSTGRQIHQRVRTWILNKIVKTFQIVLFVVLAFFWTHRFVVSTLEMVLLLFFVDFVTLALGTDNARGSPRPSVWKVGELVKISAILGLLVVGESLFLLWLGMQRVGANYNVLRTYALAILFYTELLMVFVVRERGRFWGSAPSRALLLAALADLVIVTFLMFLGIPGVLNPLPWPLLLEVLGLVTVFSLGVNDWVKARLYGLFGAQ